MPAPFKLNFEFNEKLVVSTYSNKYLKKKIFIDIFITFTNIHNF